MEFEDVLLCAEYRLCLVFFFFQAEDGIRDLTVTGVQTCALPIFWLRPAQTFPPPSACHRKAWRPAQNAARPAASSWETGSRKSGAAVREPFHRRSEERREGKSVDLGGRRIIKKKKERRRQWSE